MASSGGSRSRNGCYTCRVRKKKCDEQHPCCGSCTIRNLECYGFDTPPPDWMQGKQNWKEVMATSEARHLQSIAETQYKARRRSGQTISRPEAGQIVRGGKPPTIPVPIWWDGGVCSSLPTQKTSRQDACLLKIYLEFVFPVQFTFCPLSAPADHRWLMSGLCSNPARYQGALSVSACFDASLKEPQRIDGIGLSVEVAQRKGVAVQGLQTLVTRFQQQRVGPNDMIGVAIQMLEVMHQLLSLEVFSMLEGTWQMHHQATMTLLETIQNYNTAGSLDQGGASSHSSPLDIALGDFSCPETQRTLEFHVTCVVWIDVIACATYGSPSRDVRRFDYIPYLRANKLKTQGIMGCHSTVMASIAEITHLADWKASQIQSKSLDTEELSSRAAALSLQLVEQVHKLETQSLVNLDDLEARSRLVTLQFACAAQVYLHVILNGFGIDHPELVRLVRRGLEGLEALPFGLIIRANWAFTIIGCFAHEDLHERFRRPVKSLMEHKQPLGMTWKGLMVMEECWRLRNCQPELNNHCDWRMAMKSLGNQVLLV
ncbi:unnamed protein product [Clonostachys byssicola]|uniref:Zn(2)-C6 fungal-type domain-containing protein n=1 Tax=Clonostachys byssicola TaxID=160290 RepID=A0A9N9UAW7_9HYPO|nr:unnamed protein product [Clonostachys byssicola]